MTAAHRPRSLDRWLPPLAMIGALVGFFGPWVPHKTAALTVTGFELSELAKFFPEVQTGAVRLARYLFLAPLTSVSLLLGTWVHATAGRRAARVLGTCLAVMVAILALPPYESLGAPEYAGQLRLALIGALLAALTPLTRRIGGRRRSITMALLALFGAIAPLSQFVVLRPLIAALYNQPLGLGWGLVMCQAAFALLTCWAVLTLFGRDVAGIRQPERRGGRLSDGSGAARTRETAMDESKRIIVYGTVWCPDCALARRVLDEQGVAYEWVDIDSDPTASAYVVQVNHGFRSVPTIVFPDGSVLVEPSRSELIGKLARVA